MLDPDHVAAIADGLTECLGDERDLSIAPEFQLIFLSQPPEQQPTLTHLTVDHKVWRQWAAEGHLPAVAGPQECIDLLVSTVKGWLPDLGWQPDAVLVGCSLMYDEPAAAGPAGGTAGRVLVARDIDGRLYQATRSTAGGHAATVAVSGEAPSGRVAAVAQALTTILDNRVVAVFQLPATGYIVLRTVHPDGHNPYTVETFIDSAGVMDDDRATTHARAELDQLRQHAPSNVAHTLRLVHRTGTGDRDVWAGEPVRGNRPPIG